MTSVHYSRKWSSNTVTKNLWMKWMQALHMYLTKHNLISTSMETRHKAKSIASSLNYASVGRHLWGKKTKKKLNLESWFFFSWRFWTTCHINVDFLIFGQEMHSHISFCNLSKFYLALHCTVPCVNADKNLLRANVQKNNKKTWNFFGRARKLKFACIFHIVASSENANRL